MSYASLFKIRTIYLFTYSVIIYLDLSSKIKIKIKIDTDKLFFALTLILDHKA